MYFSENKVGWPLFFEVDVYSLC